MSGLLERMLKAIEEKLEELTGSSDTQRKKIPVKIDPEDSRDPRPLSK